MSSSESFLCDSDAEVSVALASGPLSSVLCYSDAIPAICDFCDGRSPAREFENPGIRTFAQTRIRESIAAQCWFSNDTAVCLR